MEIMKQPQGDKKRWSARLMNLGGMKGVPAATAMLTLILAPFGLYAALNQGNQILSGIFFAVIAGCMLVVIAVS